MCLFVCLSCPSLLCLFFSIIIIIMPCFLRDREYGSDTSGVWKDLADAGREEIIVRIYCIEKNLF